MCVISRDVCFIAGTDYYLDMQLLNADDTPIDISGLTIESQLLEDDTSLTQEIDLTVTIVSPTEGKFTISLDNTETQSTLPIADQEASKKYVSDILVNWSDGTKEVILRLNYTVDQGRTR